MNHCEIKIEYPKAPEALRYTLKHHSDPSIVPLKYSKIGGGNFMMAAGPCAIESWDQYAESARIVAKAGANVIRGSIFKPRTSPYSFQGLGRDALHYLSDIGNELKIDVETEVMDVRDVSAVAEHVQAIRIGARNMQNFDLLKEIADYDLPVILKRGMSSTVSEWLLAAEYLMHKGNEKVILCARGIRTFETELRNTPDLGVIPFVKTETHLPVIFDPSHATGRRDMILPFTRSAIAIGADGVIIEAHRDPECALCDGHQSLPPAQFADLVNDIRPLLKMFNQNL